MRGMMKMAASDLLSMTQGSVPRHERRNYEQEVPFYRYLLTECGHTVYYRVRVEQGDEDYGWCDQCEPWRPFQNVKSEAKETIPRRKPGYVSYNDSDRDLKRKGRKYSEDEVSLLMDEAILRNRIAKELWWRFQTGVGWTFDDAAQIADDLREAYDGRVIRKTKGRSNRQGRMSKHFVEDVMADMEYQMVFSNEHHHTEHDEEVAA